MIVFHGSDTIIHSPDILHSRKNIDFGCGFYVTPIMEQAERWAEKFLRRGKKGILNIYEMDEKVWTECNVLNFGTYSEAWLDFVTLCRRGHDTEKYDMIAGGVANDRVFNTCELYFRNFIDKEAALTKLRYEKPNQQICFKNQNTIDKYLRFEGSKWL